ncbi:MAG: hypothetical protein HGB04_06870 [Chlorobiaceae bacterium]|nr:hypothetical protein [Chlorobiaceae bacterium]
MKISKEQLDTEVMKTLGILDNMPKVQPHHLFRARLLERIDAAAGSRPAAVGFNPRLAFFGLLLSVNIGMGVLMFTRQDSATTAARSGDTAEAVGEEYGSPALSYYEQAPVPDQQDGEPDPKANQ